MSILYFTISVLATWRLTSLFVNEIGPFDMFMKIRDEYYNRKSLHKFINLDCVWCLSVYIGWIIAILTVGLRVEAFFYGLALSAGAVIIESIVRYLKIEGYSIEDLEVINQQEKLKHHGL